ncbi:Trypsin-1 [Folsomia candida]|uniref:Trypsin-1 n=1 Tax=Folsomia candida TaxID=158441 RepID=A0A226DPI0_FOLCA|nr:Trypsin-1 [Folsomia candida]
MDTSAPLRDSAVMQRSSPQILVVHKLMQTDPHEFKFMVMVDMRIIGRGFCGGAVISPDWIITAANCATWPLSGYKITAGDHNIDVVEGTEQTREVVQIVIHPNYESESASKFENDIALMKVSPPFEFNEFVQPVVIPEANFTPTDYATITGWGMLSAGGSYASNLMKVDVPLVDDTTCDVFGFLVPSMVCYGGGDKDGCLGDDGGPLVCGDSQTLCGIFSVGHCGDLPGVYTEVSYFGDWIRRSVVPTEEDPWPVESITTCGGRIAASSAEIKFQLGSSIRADQRCVWVLKPPYESSRFRLSSSGLGENDGLYLTSFANSQPGTQQQMTRVGQNYTIKSGFILVTLNVGNAPTRGFRLEFFSSGLLSVTKDVTGFARLTTSTGNFSYPIGGGRYRDNENALFVINPTAPAMRTLMFSRMDVENHSECGYDAIMIYNWYNNQYIQVVRHCGSSLPPTTTFQSGLGLVTFESDDVFTTTGFDFEWA